MFLIFRRFNFVLKLFFINMVKLDVLFKILLCTLNSETGTVLSLFLIFGDFEPQCAYKIVLIKKECMWVLVSVKVSVLIFPKSVRNSRLR